MHNSSIAQWSRRSEKFQFHKRKLTCSINWRWYILYCGHKKWKSTDCQPSFTKRKGKKIENKISKNNKVLYEVNFTNNFFFHKNRELQILVLINKINWLSSPAHRGKRIYMISKHWWSGKGCKLKEKKITFLLQIFYFIKN